MAVLNQYFAYSFKANEALDNETRGTGHIYKAVDVSSGLIANAGNTADGILISAGKQNEHCTYMSIGVGKATAGAAITLNDRLTVTTSGYVKTADAGDYAVGKALESVSSGSVLTAMFNFASPVHTTV